MRTETASAGMREMRRTSRWIVAFVTILAMAVTQGCLKMATEPGGGAASRGSMDAEVRVTSQPRGGTNVSELACTFEVTQIPGTGSEPLAIFVSWVAPCGVHKTETFLFEGGTEMFESIYTEGGYPIGMTFWATITWKDSRGNHTLASDVAPCGI